MGKYALLLVAAFSAAGATILYSSQETNIRASHVQSEYDADLISREIARSAYNGAVSDANTHGSNVQAALEAVGTLVDNSKTTDGCAGGVSRCYRREGVMQGGTYRVEASRNGGNGVDIYARGEYLYSSVGANGRPARLPKVYEINEMRSAGVLQVARSGLLSIQFVDSQAGYCSAIFLQRTPAGGAPGPLEMVYIPGHNRNGDRNVGLQRILEPGVQMNFAIGVETGCTMQNKFFEPGNAVWNASQNQYVHKTHGNRMYFVKARDKNGNIIRENNKDKMISDSTGVNAFMQNYVYKASDWNWTHWALDSGSLQNGDPQEAPWGMVESDPTNSQRWRISFEDIDSWNLPSTHKDYNDPRKSLWATKRFGYDTNNDGVGDGWFDAKRTVITPVAGKLNQYTVTETTGQDGFHDLSNWGSPSDFSDQVVMVQIIPVGDPA